jgi:hypothetical protein
MPFKSSAQNAWAHTPEGTKALGGPSKVKEWEGATDYASLPKHVPAHAGGGKVNKGYSGKTESFAAGGAVLGRTRDFLKTEDRFTGRKPPKEVTTDDNFGKSGGKDDAPAPKGKCLTPVKPRS